VNGPRTGGGGFTVELTGLAEVNLPMFSEPKHPRRRLPVPGRRRRGRDSRAYWQRITFATAKPATPSPFTLVPLSLSNRYSRLPW